MKNISLKNRKFQSFLDALIFVYQLFFGIVPETETKPYVFNSPADARALAAAVSRFELKKQGGLAR